MNWKQWLAANQYDIDFEDDSVDLMKQAFVAGLRMAHNTLEYADEKDFHWCRRQIESLIEESE